jgi:SAM-dependent methyltransferase
LPVVLAENIEDETLYLVSSGHALSGKGLTTSAYGIDKACPSETTVLKCPFQDIGDLSFSWNINQLVVASVSRSQEAESICLPTQNRCSMKPEESSSKRGRKGSEEHRFSAEGDFIERLEGSERRENIPVDSVLPRFGLGRDDIVADLGAGIGYFTFPVAREVREVIAIDMETKMIEILSKRVRERGVDNVRILRGEITELPLADTSIDHILAAFIYHEVHSQERLIRECARVLRRHGLLTVIDFQKRETPFGPPVKQRKKPEDVLRTSSKWFTLVSRFEADVFYQLLLSRN